MRADLESFLEQTRADEVMVASAMYDPEARQLLTTVARDIETALENDDAGAVATEPVEALAVRFEADHPSLAGVLRQIMDTLGKAGI